MRARAPAPVGIFAEQAEINRPRGAWSASRLYVEWCIGGRCGGMGRWEEGWLHRCGPVRYAAASDLQKRGPISCGTARVSVISRSPGVQWTRTARLVGFSGRPNSIRGRPNGVSSLERQGCLFLLRLT
eukprot:5555173-Prymnesium_polylepis.1